MIERSCPACGATVQVAYDENDNRVILEVNEQAAAPGVARYAVVKFNGEKMIVRPVADNAAGAYYPIHSFDCPAGNAGRRA